MLLVDVCSCHLNTLVLEYHGCMYSCVCFVFRIAVTLPRGFSQKLCQSSRRRTAFLFDVALVCVCCFIDDDVVVVAICCC